MKVTVSKWIGALAVALLGVVPAWAAKPIPPEYQALLHDWYARYLGRAIEPAALEFWGEKMLQMRHPRDVEADILASGEYYNRHGQNPASFVRGLFRDVAGLEPSAAQVDYWLATTHELKHRDRLTREFLEAAHKLPTFRGAMAPPPGPVLVRPAGTAPLLPNPLMAAPSTTVPAGFGRPLPAYQRTLPPM